MKTKTIAVLAAVSLLPALGFAQTTPPASPVPPAPHVPAVPPVPPSPDREDRLPKVPVTFLGIETSEVPPVVAAQLGLAKGFGLVVDYVVPDGPAAAAGVQQNDILKMLNDQILTEPDQLAKLVRSYSEGTSVTLTVLRKGTETKLTAKLAKREVPQRRGMRFGPNGKGFGDFGPDFNNEMKMLGDKLGHMDFGMFDADAMEQMHEADREAQQAAREGAREAREGAREAARAARDAARDVARKFRVSRRDNGGLKTTRIDMDKAQIVYHDEKGELKLENVSGKKVLTAKDPEDRTVFSGPVDTKEDLEKLPAEVRQRFEKLEQKDLPAIAPNMTKEERGEEANDAADDADDSEGTTVLQVNNKCAAPAPNHLYGLNIVLI